ncbi:MAG TPA: divalent-cation tolerance protein CutA [Methylophilaceae bacterium]|nr:divalent-cation tolerance protein CutA [Methylophilaceae bacterium]
MDSALTTPNKDAILVLTNMPDSNSAEKLADFLVSEKLAACVNLLSPCTSVYAWQGKIEKTAEFPMLIKTTIHCYPALEAAIIAMHPYELPEIIHVPIAGGLPAYLAWVSNNTSQPISTGEINVE